MDWDHHQSQIPRVEYHSALVHKSPLLSVDKPFSFASNSPSSQLWPPRFCCTVSTVESRETRRVWSSGNVAKEAQGLQSRGRSLPNSSGCAQCVLTVPTLTYHSFLHLLPWEVSLRCHQVRSLLQTQSLGIQGKKRTFQSLASPTPSALIANMASASGRHGES